jgi:hypothetical protein
VGLAALAVRAAREASVELAEPAGREALAALVVQGVELELNRVEALELDQVVAVPVRDPVALLAKSKSVTAVRHRGLVPVPKRVEDLVAAAAETTREPAATEAARAWEAAVTVAAAEAAA